MPRGIFERTEEYKRKLSDVHKGKNLTEEHKKNIRLGTRGIKHKSYIKSPKFLETRKNLFQKGHKINWQGGKSFEPYTIDWTNNLRISIRERDKYTCQICNEKQGDRAHHIHHIDYNKLNCNPNNLITLCHSCHMKTNRNRELWVNYFKQYGKIKS